MPGTHAVILSYEPLSSGFLIWSNTNQAVQPQKMVISRKRWLRPDMTCSENKGTDQLRGYREADLRLCFRICKKKGFLTRIVL